MSGRQPADDPARDEFLRAALRHAPDHALTPPSGVSQAILAAARRVHQSTRPAPEPAPARAPVPRHVPWQERLQWLLMPRWAGTLAAGLLGALVLGLWFEHDLPGTTRASDRDAVVVAQTERSVPAAPPPKTTTSLPAPAAAPAAQAPATRDAAAPAAARQGAPRSRSDVAPNQTPAAQDSATAPAVATAPPPKVETESALRREAPSAGAAANEARVTAAPAPAAKSAATASRRGADAAPQTDSPALFGTAPRALSKLGAAAPATGASAASPALTAWRRSTAESTARSAIWTWQPGDAASPRSFEADGQAWLLRLVQSARGRWVDVAEAGDGEAATEVRWWRDDQPHARLRIEAEGLRWIEPGGRIRYAPMGPEALARLRGF